MHTKARATLPGGSESISRPTVKTIHTNHIEEFMNAVTKTEGAALAVTMGFNDLASTMGD